MKNRLVALKDRLVLRLMTQPECLDMSEFSRLSALYVTTFCLAGLILDESHVGLKYGSEGRATGLLPCEASPGDRWITYEMSLSEKPVDPQTVLIPAKAREIWAAQYGDAAAKLLPFYARDWEMETDQVHRVTPEEVIRLLQVVNEVANKVAAAA